MKDIYHVDGSNYLFNIAHDFNHYFEVWHDHDDFYEMILVMKGSSINNVNGEVKIYYGAADANVSLATANVDDLVKACLE